jgi:putative transposase
MTPNPQKETRFMSDNIIQLNEQVIKTELKDLVKQSVEETLNTLLEQEAIELTNASKCSGIVKL